MAGQNVVSERVTDSPSAVAAIVATIAGSLVAMFHALAALGWAYGVLTVDEAFRDGGGPTLDSGDYVRVALSCGLNLAVAAVAVVAIVTAWRLSQRSHQRASWAIAVGLVVLLALSQYFGHAGFLTGEAV